MANTPKQPDDPPAEGTSPAYQLDGQGRQGVAGSKEDHGPASRPTADRAATETAAARIEDDPKS